MDQPLDGEAFRLLWRTLLRRVRRRFYWLDQTSIEDALGDAILHWLAQDGGKTGELPVRSVYGEVCRRVGNSVRTDRRRQRREREYARQKKNRQSEIFFVPKELSAENISIEDQNEALLRLLEGCHCAWEQAFVMLRSEGNREVTAYADVLGMTRCPLEEQQRAVNRAWNRLRKRLQRQMT